MIFQDYSTFSITRSASAGKTSEENLHIITNLDDLGMMLEPRRCTLFRWETLDVYEVASDGLDYRRYLDGEPEPE